jgi:hypothetical protein
MMKCPATGNEVPTGLEADTEEQQRMLIGSGKVRSKCTFCDREHVLTMRNTSLS